MRGRTKEDFREIMSRAIINSVKEERMIVVRMPQPDGWEAIMRDLSPVWFDYTQPKKEHFVMNGSAPGGRWKILLLTANRPLSTRADV